MIECPDCGRELDNNNYKMVSGKWSHMIFCMVCLDEDPNKERVLYTALQSILVEEATLLGRKPRHNPSVNRVSKNAFKKVVTLT